MTADLALAPELLDALRGLASTDKLLVALDFDGTLAPEVDDPERARALPEAREAVLRLLELPATRVALVSGRALASLIRVSELPESTLLIGSHGVEVRLDSPEDGFSLSELEREHVVTLRRLLEGVAEGIDGVWVEVKPAGFALHTRLATAEDGARAQSLALSETSAQLDDLTVRNGKDVLEFSIRSTTKGEGIRHLREYTGASAVFFTGDDVTDEDGFAALLPGDLGLKIGAGETRAGHRISGPQGVAAVLHTLAELREQWAAGTR